MAVSLIKKEALWYHGKFKFNVTRILKIKNKFNKEKNLYKCPGHEWFSLKFKRQSKIILLNASWDKTIGIGTILGYNKLRAIDIDKCNDIDLVFNILEILELPKKYEWVVRSGSKNGFHILFYAEDNKISDFESLKVAYGSNFQYKKTFKRMEFRWQKHLVLPPSKHRTGNKYEFLFSKPIKKPLNVSLDGIIKVIEKYCLY